MRSSQVHEQIFAKSLFIHKLKPKLNNAKVNYLYSSYALGYLPNQRTSTDFGPETLIGSFASQKLNCNNNSSK